MKTSELIRTSLRFNQSLTDRFVADVPDERMAEQPTGVVNHAAWTIGHLTVTLYSAVGVLGGTQQTPEGWAEKFGMGSTPTADRADYPAKDVLLAELAQVVDAVDQALAKATPEQLDVPLPDENWRKIFPTVAHMVAGLCGSHYAYHQGQLSVWRKAAGFPKAFPA